MLPTWSSTQRYVCRGWVGHLRDSTAARLCGSGAARAISTFQGGGRFPRATFSRQRLHPSYLASGLETTISRPENHGVALVKDWDVPVVFLQAFVVFTFAANLNQSSMVQDDGKRRVLFFL